MNTADHSETTNAHPAQMLDAPLDALHCLSCREAEILKTVFDVVTIRDFLNLKFIKCVNAINVLAADVEEEKTKEEDTMLDEALGMTFPASDPTSVNSSIARIEAML
jgi:hypothetical protein